MTVLVAEVPDCDVRQGTLNASNKKAVASSGRVP